MIVKVINFILCIWEFFELVLDGLYSEVVLFVWFVDFFLFDRFMIGIGGGSGGCGIGKLFLLLNWILMLCIWGWRLICDFENKIFIINLFF